MVGNGPPGKDAVLAETAGPFGAGHEIGGNLSLGPPAFEILQHGADGGLQG